ncbi:hypothetical protein PHYBLDRAFT_70052 [Phycomyces blakesleeanus NRRL 1555(-)]|uniref:Uncharacterized protein n=1 Tax=Phycomyces blakesleeanus (strain ATCC 8743b / DSM 1359 / FGSC 10004 / NBRC 33097 / NRRL 1555) TaxID=763407 RepID=A0A162PP69_PHYB8|nr:hypothetical protein PHYBLDRAFT_70052 [Phycomyces blakesleeanus NRRL 1555(-)]OAD71616.1 hypothetical protein PHYBLDRAFT_70052 [Phycomyces blakesleeanus NRRL 1555(-)]|eukprot:XP_018289656.1 hypothetical protein PHYBLDRAFT_70052 [Phycomyces blakesleeanus NRRL 1555(-)]
MVDVQDDDYWFEFFWCATDLLNASATSCEWSIVLNQCCGGRGDLLSLRLIMSGFVDADMLLFSILSWPFLLVLIYLHCYCSVSIVAICFERKDFGYMFRSNTSMQCSNAIILRFVFLGQLLMASTIVGPLRSSSFCLVIFSTFMNKLKIMIKLRRYVVILAMFAVTVSALLIVK